MVIKYFGGFDRSPSLEHTQTYMNKDCAYFTMALHKLAGYRIVAVPAHFMARDPQGMFWDIRGKMNGEQASDGLSEGDWTDVDGDDVKADLLTGLWSDGPFMESRLKRAKEVLRLLAPSILPKPRAIRVEWSWEMLKQLAEMEGEAFEKFHRDKNAFIPFTQRQLENFKQRIAEQTGLENITSKP